MADVLDRRALNRATLARQLLLERASLPVGQAVEHLAGLQAQTTHTWYTALWSRLADFDPEATGRLLADRQLVRLALMRSTIHLVTAADCLWMRPLLAASIARSLGNHRRGIAGVDHDAVAAAGRELLEAEPLTAAALGRRLAERFPEGEPADMAMLVRVREALVQLPPRGVWGRSGPAVHTTAESWLGRPLDVTGSPDRLVLRYLAAFGPASVMDAQAWSGLTRLGPVFEGLRPRLRPFRDEDGRELFDLPDAPRPDPEVRAPVRFLPDYDNLLLAHADRSRFGVATLLGRWAGERVVPGSVLVDGAVRAGWSVVREGERARLEVRPDGRLTAADRRGVEAEGERLLAFLAADVGDRDVSVAAAG